MLPIILTDALKNIAEFEKTLDWQPFHPGVQIARIAHPIPGETHASTAFLKYQPGASVPHHTHSGYEHIFILQGSQIDRAGEHKAGTVVINPPGSSHSIATPLGCIVLIIWEKPVLLTEPPD